MTEKIITDWGLTLHKWLKKMREELYLELSEALNILERAKQNISHIENQLKELDKDIKKVENKINRK